MAASGDSDAVLWQGTCAHAFEKPNKMEKERKKAAAVLLAHCLLVISLSRWKKGRPRDEEAVSLLTSPRPQLLQCTCSLLPSRGCESRGTLPGLQGVELTQHSSKEVPRLCSREETSMGLHQETR